ncbi:cytochrome P450 2B10-like [Vicugna pacos]|uniref:Cytochrome P450 2B10-like n=1 Tax=Vicugna pacos TaxID=30538 RepID=A0ABM5DNM2_VICPA
MSTKFVCHGGLASVSALLHPRPKGNQIKVKGLIEDQRHDDYWRHSAAVAGLATGTSQVELGCLGNSGTEGPTPWAHTTSASGELTAAGVWTPGPCTHGGIYCSNGQRWQTLRNFALGALKGFGLEMRTIKERVQEEAACLLGEFQATIGAPFDPRRLLDNAMSVICSVVFGNRYGYEDLEFLKLLDLFNDTFHVISSRRGEMRASAPQIQRHRQRQQPGVTLDFIDCFLDQVDKVKGHAALNSIPAAHQQKPDKRSTYLLCPQEQDPESHF